LSGYLTPDSVPDDFVCRTILIPNDERWVSVVTGALNSLAEARNWQRDGELLPEEAASAWFPRFDDFCFKTYTCEGRVIGEIVCTAGTENPSSNWLPCDGSSLVRDDFAALYGKIGTTYGAVDGAHFSVPDLRGRGILGAGQGNGLTDRSIGDVVGTETHQLSASEMPSHTHGYNYTLASPAAAPGTPGPVVIGYSLFSTTSAGGDGSHNNMQPSLALSYWIVAQ